MTSQRSKAMTIYELYGIVHHTGQSKATGSYFCEISIEGQWYHCYQNQIFKLGAPSIRDSETACSMYYRVVQ